MKLAEQIEQYLLEQTRRLFPESPDLDDAETVHRMRVASRRLRVGLEVFADGFDPRECRQLLRQIARLGDALGVVRVLDVNLTLLRGGSVRNIPSNRAEQLALLRKRVPPRTELEELYRAMTTAKIASRVETLVVQRRGKTDGLAALADLRRVLRRCLERFDEKHREVAFHKLRIAVKKYRYGLEIAETVFGADVGGRMESVKTLQELMGTCHDVEVLMERLPKGPLKKYFAKEHRRRYETVKKFLDGGRRWVKKVKLDNE